MATNDTAHGETKGRYDSVETSDGGLILYDRQNEDAWLQAAVPTTVAQ